jgi:hypothetical protein
MENIERVLKAASQYESIKTLVVAQTEILKDEEDR